MSVSLGATGFREPDEEFNKKFAAYKALEAAAEEIPESLQQYFNWEEPSEHGLSVELPTTEWRGEYAEGYELKIDELPKNIKVIRFYLS